MLAYLQQEAFLIGATLVVIYQAAKFTELNLTDPITNRYIALLPDAKVRDFASSGAYHTALFAFLGVSLIVYYGLCQISPELLKGAARLLGPGEPSAALEGIPYPLYIAALFIGLTQPIVPIFSQFVNAQRDFFHDRINVPRRIIDISDALTQAVEERAGSDRRRLANEVRNLSSGDFITSLRSYGDAAYYNLQLEKLELGDEDALARTIKASSAKELRLLIERLVLCALVATMRRSGPNALVKVAGSLAVRVPTAPPNNGGHLVASFVSSGVLFTLALLILANIFWLLVGPIAKLFPNQQERMWPEDLGNVAVELCYIVPPIIISLLVAVVLLVPSGRSQPRDAGSDPGTSLSSEFVNFFRSSAVVLGLCIGITVLIQLGLLFYAYGTWNVPPEARTASKFILPVIQAFIPVAVCLFTTWYLVSSSAQPPCRGLSFVATLLTIAGATALVGFFCELIFVHEYLRTRPQAAPGWEHVLFGVMANVMVSISAFASIALFFTARDRRPEMDRVHHAHPKAATKSDALRRAYRAINPHAGANGHANRPEV